MHLVVAIQAGLTQQVLGRHAARQAAFVLRQARVTVLRVAALTQRRCSHAQHSRVIRSVWIVAVAAILGHRRVFPKVGATGFGVAVIAGVVGRRPREQSIGRVAVRIVAAAAVHLSLPHRVCIRLHGLRALLLVAVETDLGLRCRTQYRVAFDVTIVAVGAGDSVVVVSAAVPGETGIGQMAVDAVGVLLGNRRARVGAETYHWRSFLAAPYAPRVITTRSVAGFALQLTVTERGVRIGGHCVLAAKYGEDRLIVMALKAGVRALLAVVRRFVILRRDNSGRRDGHKGHRQQEQAALTATFCQLSASVEPEATNTMQFADVGRRTRAVTELAGLVTGRNHRARIVLAGQKVAAVLNHVVLRQ